jgi:hypothetical protein
MKPSLRNWPKSSPAPVTQDEFARNWNWPSSKAQFIADLNWALFSYAPVPHAAPGWHSRMCAGNLNPPASPFLPTARKTACYIVWRRTTERPTFTRADCISAGGTTNRVAVGSPVGTTAPHEHVICSLVPRRPQALGIARPDRRLLDRGQQGGNSVAGSMASTPGSGPRRRAAAAWGMVGGRRSQRRRNPQKRGGLKVEANPRARVVETRVWLPIIGRLPVCFFLGLRSFWGRWLGACGVISISGARRSVDERG